MKHTLLTLAMAAIALHASAASTDPFDFDYEITGNVLERPALVFNDGDATYVQPRAGQDLKVEGGRNQGPYIVVSGTPETIRYTANGSSASAQWKKANHFMGGKGLAGAQNNGDLPSGFVGFSGRLALIGTRTRLDSTRPLNATLPFSQLVKALVPQGWTGSAQKEVDLTSASNFATRDGENWMQSLDRLVSTLDLYADVDFDKQHVSLRRMAPKSAAVNYVAPAGAVSAPLSDPIAAIAAENSGPLGDSLLASKLGALAIRDGDDYRHEPRRVGDRRRAVVGGALAGSWRGHRVCRSGFVRRARPQRRFRVLDVRRRRSSRFAAVSTASRWPSSWPHRVCSR